MYGALGTGIRVGTWEGYTGYYPATQLRGRPTAKRSMNQRSGPRKALQGPGVGGFMHSAPGRPVPPLRGPVGALQAPPCTSSSKPASWPKGRDLTSFLGNLVKTRKCRLKVSKRPLIVPICQNGSRKSPLEILGFPFSLAFSPKELMDHFDAYSGIYVKMTKCRPVVHTPDVTRKGRRYPHVMHAASCLCACRSSSAQRGILIDPVYP